MIIIYSNRLLPMVMESRLDVYRTPREREHPRGLVEVVRRRGGRPRAPVVLHVRTIQDVETLRRRNVPLRLLTPESVSEAGYPVTFEPRLVLPRSLVSQVISELRVLAVKNDDTVR